MTAKCIRGKARAGKISKERAEQAAQMFEGFETQLRHQNAPRVTEGALAQTERALSHMVRMRKRARLQAMKVQAEVGGRISDADDALNAALSTLEFDATRRETGNNVLTEWQAIRRMAHAKIADVLDRFESRFAGLDILSPEVRARRTAALDDIGRERFGEESGSREAKDLAEALEEGFTFLLDFANASGFSIPRRIKWGLPTRHDRAAIAADKDAWLDFTLDRLDRAEMIDFTTGQPFTDTALRRLMLEVRDDIITDGLNSVQPGGFVGRSITARRAQKRFFVYRDFQSWKEYQDRFGSGDIFETILDHINGFSRDIGTVRVLGPNPDATLRFMETAVAKAQGRAALEASGEKAARLARQVGKGQPELRDLYASVSGELDRVGNEWWANWMGGFRNILSSALLGRAVFSALSDINFAKITADLNGLSASRIIGRHAKMMTPAGRGDRATAQRLGFINENVLGMMIGQARYTGEALGPKWTRFISDVSMRASGLSPMTQSMRMAFGMEFLGVVTANVGKRFDAIPPLLRRALEDNAIGPGEWDLMRATKLWRDTKSGAEFLRPQDIIGAITDAGPLFDRHAAAAVKLSSMILTEIEFAVPSQTRRAKALLTLGHRRGTLIGEIGRNVGLFKSFPVTLVMTHLMRLFSARFTRYERARMFAHLVIGTTILGTLGEQLSQISAGRDPLPLDPTTPEGRKTWLKGAARGGGLGIFGDFIFASQSRFGQGPESTALGPVFSSLRKLGKLTAGNVLETIEKGTPENVGREFLSFARDLLPGRSNWYLSLGFERMVLDEIQMMIDPDYAQSFSNAESRARTEFGQTFFSPPGSGFPPERGPDLERALR